MSVHATTSDLTTSAAAFERAQAVIPGGVNSPVRAFGNVGGTPRFLASARGAYVTDVDGNEYVDLVGSWGPALLGHAHPEVVEAVREAAGRGLSLRRADGHRGRARRRDPVPRAAGREGPAGLHRHRGDHDRAAAGPRLHRSRPGHQVRRQLPRARRRAAGLRRLRRRDPRPARLGRRLRRGRRRDDRPAVQRRRRRVEAAFAEHGDRIAAVITEASPANMGVVPPLPGFNAALRRLTHAHGALLIQDEVLTGFRVGYSGWWGLEGLREGWSADLYTFGKVIGGGLPVAAVGGRRDVMAQLAPVGPVYQAGTLSGNPVATAAGLATLRLADQDVYARVDAVAAQLRTELGAALVREGLPHTIQWAGNLFSTFFGADAARQGARDYAAVLATESWRYAPFFHSLLESGVYAPPSPFEAWFVSAAHDDAAARPHRQRPPGRRPRRRDRHQAVASPSRPAPGALTHRDGSGATRRDARPART